MFSLHLYNQLREEMGGRGFESYLSSLFFCMKIEKKALRFVALFAFKV